MPLQIKTIFNDPTPNSIISLRYVNHMAEIAHTYTDLSPKEFEDFMYFLSLIAKKMAGTWKHLSRYTEIENALVEAEKSKPPIETLNVQHLSQAQDLILELDGFLVQLKSTLDYLAKLPGTIIGKKIWPYLATFGDKGDKVANVIRRNIPNQWSTHREILTDIVLKDHRPWLEMAISARDRINHLIGEGIDHDSFIVAKTTINGVETIVVPMWLTELTTKQYLEHTWLNLIKLIEQFTIGFLSMRFKPGYGYVNWPYPNIIQSPIIVMPDKGVEVTMQVGQIIFRNTTPPTQTSTESQGNNEPGKDKQ